MLRLFTLDRSAGVAAQCTGSYRRGMVADIVSGSAALATLVAVYYARETVRESNKARQKASTARTARR
jgi:hypothetical protein